MEIQQDLKESVKIKQGTRIYVCSDFFYNDKVKLTGAFIIGKESRILGKNMKMMVMV